MEKGRVRRFQHSPKFGLDLFTFEIKIVGRDFLIIGGREPALLVETKLSDDHASKSLLKFQSALNVPAIQLVNKSGIHKLLSNGKQRLLIISAPRWLAGLP